MKASPNYSAHSQLLSWDFVFHTNSNFRATQHHLNISLMAVGNTEALKGVLSEMAGFVTIRNGDISEWDY